MSLTRRLRDLARSNLNNLMDRVREWDDRRRAGNDEDDRDDGERDARDVAEDEGERLKREEAREAAEREEYVRQSERELDEELGDRRARPAAEGGGAAPGGAGRGEAAGRRREGNAGSRSGRSGGEGRGRGRTRRGGGAVDPRVAQWYANLELKPGASLSELKDQYRSMMRRYHPDLHGSDPEKQRIANELTMRLTEAYEGLKKHIGE